MQGVYVLLVVLYAFATPVVGAAAFWLYEDVSVGERIIACAFYIGFALVIAVLIGMFSACTLISCQS
jgi:hypothetical protein